MCRIALVAASLLVLACGGAPESAPQIDDVPEQDSAVVAPDARVEPPSGEAATDAGHDHDSAARADVAPPTVDATAIDVAPEATVDSGSTEPDAGADVRSVCDGAPPVPPLDCTGTSPTCMAVRAENERIHAQFPMPCECGAMACAGVKADNAVTTDPVTCRNGAWTLAGTQSGSTWSPWFECSAGCAAGKICNR